MTPALWGALCGAGVGVGVLLSWSRIAAIRHPQLALRVLPYLRDVPAIGPVPGLRTAGLPGGAVHRSLRRAGEQVERILGGATSVERRLRRAGLEQPVHEFRVEQVIWGLIGFAAMAAIGIVRTLAGASGPLPWLLLCAAAFGCGVIARDTWLTTQVQRRERRIVEEFPALAELLALAVAAGESPVAALDRVVRRSGGELSSDLAGVLATIRTGEPVSSAFDSMAASTGLPLVARFAQGIAIAVERGTPLADVLHAQAADVREAGRRQLIESGARREVLMLVPVVFLVLPVTVLFAFYPGVIGLSLTTP